MFLSRRKRGQSEIDIAIMLVSGCAAAVFSCGTFFFSVHNYFKHSKNPKEPQELSIPSSHSYLKDLSEEINDPNLCLLCEAVNKVLGTSKIVYSKKGSVGFSFDYPSQEELKHIYLSLKVEDLDKGEDLDKDEDVNLKQN